MPSKDDRDDSANNSLASTAVGAGLGAVTLSSVAAAGNASGSWLFDPAQVDVEDATGFVDVDVAALREHDDLLELDADDVRESWTSDGSTSLDRVIDDVDAEIDLPVEDAWTAIDVSGIEVGDIDRVAAIGAGQFDDADTVGGIVLEGSFDTAAVTDGLETVTDLAADGGDEYDRYAVSDDRLDSDVVVAVSDGRALAGGIRELDTDPDEAVDLLIDAYAGEADRFGPQSEYAADVLTELSGAAGIAGVEWDFAAESGSLVPDHVEGALTTASVLSDDVDLTELTNDIGAAAVGVYPDDPSARLIIAYDGDAPVEAAAETVDQIEDRFATQLDGIKLTVDRGADLLVVEATSSADHLRELQSDFGSSFRTASTLRRGVTWGVIPTLQGATATARGHWNAFVDTHL